MGKAAKAAGSYTKAFAKQVVHGLSETVNRKEPGRWTTWARKAGTAFGILAVKKGDLDDELDKGDGTMPPMSIEFDITKEVRKRTPPELLGSIRKLHVNMGHPTNEDLRRCL